MWRSLSLIRTGSSSKTAVNRGGVIAPACVCVCVCVCVVVVEWLWVGEEEKGVERVGYRERERERERERVIIKPTKTYKSPTSKDLPFTRATNR